MTDISVVIPVGPSEANRRWLGECLATVGAQTCPAAEVLLIDDMAGLLHPASGAWKQQVKIWETPWLSGVAHSFNFGVALAACELVVMLGSDDLLEPWALADCARQWERDRDPLGYYSLDVRYMDTGETQSIACNAAMVTKALWRHTGGFPVQSAVGAPDAALLSIMMAAKGRAGNIRRVRSDQPPYLYRRHPDTNTQLDYARFEKVILAVRDTVTRDWQPPQWGRTQQ